MSGPDHSRIVALYAQLIAHFREQILDGTLPPGSRLPSELESAERFGVSRGTVRQAMSVLVNEGLVKRIQGRGTFVRTRVAPVAQDQPTVGTGKRIGVLLSYAVSELDLSMLAGVQATARARGYQVSFAYTEESAEQQTRDIDWLRSDHVLGLIIYPLSDITYDESIWSLKAEEFPFVLLDRYFPDLNTDFVTADNEGAGYRATQHLIILGHRRISFAHSFVGTLLTTSVRDRYTGYRRALREYGVGFDESFVYSFPRWPQDELHNPCDEFLARSDGPTAIVTSTDGLAIEIVHSAQRVGRRVPEDLAIVSVDNLSLSSAMHPPLTTVAQPAREMGVSAANLLINRIEGQGGPPQHIALPTTLIVRASCGARLHVQKSSERRTAAP